MSGTRYRKGRRPITMTTQELLDAGLGPKLPTRNELLALGGIPARMQVIIGGPDNTAISGTDEVWCEWNGRHFLARSRHGASFALCRLLVAAGCPDQAMQVYRDSDDQHQYTLRSIHKAATRTIYESATQPIASARFREHPEAGKALGGRGVECDQPTPRWSEPIREEAPPPPRARPTEVTDAKHLNALEHLWRLFRDGAHGELAAAISIAPELVRARFMKDRALGRTSS